MLEQPISLNDLANLAQDDAPESAIQPATDNRTRWVITVGETPHRELNPFYPTGRLDVDSPLVSGGSFRRCVLTPIKGRDIPAAVGAVPAELITKMIDGTAFYTRYVGPEVENLLMLHGNRDGLVEIPELLGMDTDPANSTAFFFPTWPELPEINAINPKRPELDSLEALVRERMELIATVADTKKQRILTAVGNALLESIKRVDTYHRQTVAASNVALEVKDNRHKPTYDGLDDLAFARTGLARRNEALDNLAGERQVVVEMTGNTGGISREDLLAVIEASKGGQLTPESVADMLKTAIAQGVQAGIALATNAQNAETTKKK